MDSGPPFLSDISSKTLVSLGCYNKVHSLGSLNKEHLFLSLEAATVRSRSLQIQYLPLPRPVTCTQVCLSPSPRSLCHLYPDICHLHTGISVTFMQCLCHLYMVSVTFSQLCLTKSKTNIENVPGLLRRIYPGIRILPTHGGWRCYRLDRMCQAEPCGSADLENLCCPKLRA